MKWLFRIFYAGLTVILFTLIATWQLYSYLNTPSENAFKPLFVNIQPGSSFSSIVQDFETQGIISKPSWLVFYALLTNDAQHIQAGEYQIKHPITPAKLLEILTTGQVVYHQITFPEGWNFKQILERLLNKNNIQHQLKGLSDSAIMTLIGKEGEHPEGRFFPDSYSYVATSTDVQLLQRAYLKMEQILDEEWQQRSLKLPYNNAYEALIMASIVEKETAVFSEYNNISGVFVRRLNSGMRLQTDPTVIYGLGSSFNGNLTRKHLRADTIYNTYMHHGLPPTPIAMPGRAAINAALHPASGSSLYFVARGDGRHLFSNTLAEHRAAVRHFQIKKRNANYRSTPAK